MYWSVLCYYNEILETIIKGKRFVLAHGSGVPA